MGHVWFRMDKACKCATSNFSRQRKSMLRRGRKRKPYTISVGRFASCFRSAHYAS